MLRRCLRALSVQTRTADEVIVVDNASTDESGQVAADADAIVVRCDALGIPAASAEGYDRATGEIILRLDADCVPDDTWIHTMQQAFQADPGAAAFTGGARFVDGPRILRAPLATAYLGAYAVIGFAALGHIPLFGSNMGFRRAAWRSVRLLAHRTSGIHDDFDLAFHLGEHYRIRRVPLAPMGMSMRALRDASGFARRVRRGFVTVLMHWPHDFPPVRWERRALRRMISRRTGRGRIE